MSGFKTTKDNIFKDVSDLLAENSPAVKLSEIITILENGINILKNIDNRIASIESKIDSIEKKNVSS